MKNSPLLHAARKSGILLASAACVALLVFTASGGTTAMAQNQAATATPASDTQMSVRLGAHSDYTRLVFDFPSLTAYTAETAANGQTRLIFTTPLTPAVMPKPAGAVSSIASQRVGDAALAITLNHPAGAGVKHYRLMRRVVVDVFPQGQPAEKPPVQVAQAAPPAKPATPAAAADPKPAPAPATAQTQQPAAPAAPVTPVADAEATPPPSPASPVTAATIKLPVNPSIMVDELTPPATATTAVETTPPTTIRLSSVEPAKMAVFTRDNTLWLVMEGKPASAAAPQISGPDESLLGTPKILTFDGGKAYRYVIPAGRDVTVTRKSLMWEVSLGRNLTEAPSIVSISVNRDQTSGRARLLADIKDSGRVLSFEDPVVGDKLMVVPVSNPQARVQDLHRYANVELLPAEAGMVVRPIADDVRVLRLGDYVTVSAPDGIAATPGASASPALIDTGTSFTAGETRRLFDFPNWLQGGRLRLNENRQTIEKQASAARSDVARQEALLRLALLHFANNFGHETLGILRMIMDEDPEMAQNPNIIALRGAAAAMAGHYDDALKDLSTPAIQQHPEVNLWIGYAAAASEQWRRADQSFPRTNELLATYPPEIGIPMTIYMAESALRLGHVDSARALLDTMNNLPVANLPHHEAAMNYLRGEAARQGGRFAEAISYWEPVANGLDRLYHTKASLALTLLQVQDKRISLDDAVARLDSLRFAWRGDGLEVQTLAALGRMKVLNGQYFDGLKDLRAAADLADQLRDDSMPLRQEMARTVENLFSGDNSARINPLEAVSVYSEFEGLLPDGESGSTAALHFADYLVSIDLLDRAAGLINRALQDTADPVARADIGARLAAIYLIDSKPSLALEALGRTEAPGAGAELVERRTLLKARAQSQLNLTAEAAATLAPLDTPAAKRLSADVLWRARRWGDAAIAIEKLLPATAPARLDDDTARLVMNAAVGYKLAGDTARLGDIRRRFATPMAGTTFGPTFTVVTRDGGSATLSDRDTILRVAGEVDMFKSLLDSYKASTRQDAATSNTRPTTGGNGG